MRRSSLRAVPTPPSLAGHSQCATFGAGVGCQPGRESLSHDLRWTPPNGPLSTLIFSLSMTEVLHKAVRQTTSEVTTLSYIDDTTLLGPADDVAQVLQDLPRAVEGTGL